MHCEIIDLFVQTFFHLYVPTHLYYLVILSLLTLVFFSGWNPLVWVSGLFGIIIAPTAAFQQHKLTQVEALAQTNERLSSEVDQLTAENGRLTASVQQMEESVLK